MIQKTQHAAKNFLNSMKTLEGFVEGGEWSRAFSRIIQYIEDFLVQYTELIIDDVLPTRGKDVVEPDEQTTRSKEAIAFGKWLRESRSQHEMTQAEVAEVVDYSHG